MGHVTLRALDTRQRHIVTLIAVHVTGCSVPDCQLLAAMAAWRHHMMTSSLEITHRRQRDVTEMSSCSQTLMSSLIVS